MNKLRPFLPAIILLAGCAMVLQSRSQDAVPLGTPVGSTTPAYEGFVAKDQILSKEEIAVAGMTEYVARTFSHDSVIAFTTLVSYYDRQMQGHTIHSPRNCLPGAGWEVLSPGTRALTVNGATHIVNHYVLKNGAATAIVYYWYQGRGRVVADEYSVKWNLLRDAALKGRTEEALVRVVLPVPPAGSKRAAESDSLTLRAVDSLGADVAGKLLATVDKALPKR